MITSLNRQLSLYVSLKQHQAKVPASSSWPIQIHDSSLNITLIQFIYTPWLLLFAATGTFSVNPISFSLFLTIKNWLLLLLICFSFVLFKPNCFEFSILMLWRLLWSNHIIIIIINTLFPFNKLSILFNLDKMFDTADLEQLTSFTTLCWIKFLKVLYNRLYCFSWHLSCWDRVSFHLVRSNNSLRSVSTFF